MTLKSLSRSNLLASSIPEYDAKDSTHSHEDEICDCMNLGGTDLLERDMIGGCLPLPAKYKVIFSLPLKANNSCLS